MWGVLSPNSSYFKRKIGPAFERLGIPWKGVSNHDSKYMSLRECANDDTIDKVYVCLPTLKNADYVVTLLNAGKAVLVEKGWHDVAPETPLRMAEMRNVGLGIATQQKYSPRVIHEFTQGPVRAAACFRLPEADRKVLVEDVGFYPIMEMLSRVQDYDNFEKQEADVEYLKFMVGEKVEESVQIHVEIPGELTHSWKLTFSIGGEFHQGVSLFRPKGAGYDVIRYGEPFTSRTDLTRYEKVISEFDPTVISKEAQIWPYAYRFMQLVKEAL